MIELKELIGNVGDFINVGNIYGLKKGVKLKDEPVYKFIKTGGEWYEFSRFPPEYPETNLADLAENECVIYPAIYKNCEDK